MVPQAKLCQNIVFHYLYNDKDLNNVYSDKDLTTVHKISPVLYNVCIAMKCYTFTGSMLALVLYY